MNFIQDIRHIAEKELDFFGLQHPASEDDRVIISRWVNVKLRLIQACPREVFLSKEICLKLGGDLGNAISVIKKKFENGEDLNPHLSKSLLKEDYTDLLFCDWGIYHLHLKLIKRDPNSFFFDRSNEVLLVKIALKQAYFIDIGSHDISTWCQKELLNILERNWPHILEPFRLKGTLSVESELNTPEDINALRNAGVTVIQNLCNGIYAPMGGGITTAKTSTLVSIKTNNLYRLARNSEKWVEENKERIKQDINAQIDSNLNELRFRLALDVQGFCIIEQQTNTLITRLSFD